MLTGRAIGRCSLDIDGLAGGGLIVELGIVCDGDDAGIGIDGEQAAGIVGQRVGDGIGAVRIGCKSGDADRGADCHVLIDRIGGGIGV